MGSIWRYYAMNCPYCNGETKIGRILVWSTDITGYLEWYAEEDFEKKGILQALKRKPIYIEVSNDGYYPNSFFCERCNKVFGEFPTESSR
jgi:hypothetical protein